MSCRVYYGLSHGAVGRGVPWPWYRLILSYLWTVGQFFYYHFVVLDIKLQNTDKRLFAVCSLRAKVHLVRSSFCNHQTNIILDDRTGCAYIIRLKTMLATKQRFSNKTTPSLKVQDLSANRRWRITAKFCDVTRILIVQRCVCNVCYSQGACSQGMFRTLQRWRPCASFNIYRQWQRFKADHYSHGKFYLR